MEMLGLLVHQCLLHSSAQLAKGPGIAVDIMHQIRCSVGDARRRRLLRRRIFARTSDGQVVDDGRSAAQWVGARRIAAMAVTVAIALTLTLTLGMWCGGRGKSLGGRETSLVPPHVVLCCAPGRSVKNRPSNY